MLHSLAVFAYNIAVFLALVALVVLTLFGVEIG